MATEVTSSISPVVTGAGRGKATTYTATKVTGPIGNPPKYNTEIIRYDDAKGSNPTTIGSRDSDTGKITWNENAKGRTKLNASKFEKASTTQMNSPEIKDMAGNASQKAALNKSSGQGNQAQGKGDNSATSTTSGGGTGAGDIGKGEGRMRFPNPLVYPTSLTAEGSDRDVITFNMMQYLPSGFGSGGAGGAIGSVGPRKQGKIIGRVVLPVPGGISDTNMADWSSGTMGPIEAAAANAVLKAFNDNLEEGGKAVGEAVTAALESPGTETAIKATIAGAATGMDAQVLQRGAGAVMNPNMELLFNGPQLRTFGFNFKLSPRSADEAKTVIKIMRFFKQGMAPIRTADRFFLKSPHTFQIKYQRPGARGDQPYLNKFKECALTNCGIQYTPDGNYNTFSDGVMTSYSMQLSFNELTPIYNDDYTNLDNDSDSMIGY